MLCVWTYSAQQKDSTYIIYFGVFFLVDLGGSWVFSGVFCWCGFFLTRSCHFTVAVISRLSVTADTHHWKPGLLRMPSNPALENDSLLFFLAPKSLLQYTENSANSWGFLQPEALDGTCPGLALRALIRDFLGQCYWAGGFFWSGINGNNFLQVLPR